MKNNQFKKEIRKKIEDLCKLWDFTSLYVDETNNSRKIYIYTLDYRYAGMFTLWLNSDYIHLCFTNLATISIKVNRLKDINVPYTDFHRIIDTLEECFEIMDKDGN